jgi:hypothetical protein
MQFVACRELQNDNTKIFNHRLIGTDCSYFDYNALALLLTIHIFSLSDIGRNYIFG